MTIYRYGGIPGPGPNAALKGYAATVFLILAAACSNISFSPNTFNEGMAYAQALHTTVLQGITAGLDTGKLSSADAQSMLNGADAAQAILDAARAAAGAGQNATASAELRDARAKLEALNSKLPAGRP